MSEVFDGYLRRYCELSGNLWWKCSSAATFKGEQRKQKILKIKNGLYEADSLIRKMDLEARGLEPSVKAILLAELRDLKSDLNFLKNDVKRIASTNLNQLPRDELLKARYQLLEARMADTSTATANQRERLVVSTEKLDNSSNRIPDSRRVMLETEELGVPLLQDLHGERQALLHADDTMYGVDDNISRSKKIMTNISRRMDRNKWVIGSIIAVLVIAVALVLYFKLK